MKLIRLTNWASNKPQNKRENNKQLKWPRQVLKNKLTPKWNNKKEKLLTTKFHQINKDFKYKSLKMQTKTFRRNNFQLRNKSACKTVDYYKVKKYKQALLNLQQKRVN